MCSLLLLLGFLWMLLSLFRIVVHFWLTLVSVAAVVIFVSVVVSLHTFNAVVTGPVVLLFWMLLLPLLLLLLMLLLLLLIAVAPS